MTGSPGAIRRAADNYGVKHARVETTSTAGYTMSHTADIYLIDAGGRYLLAYPFGTPAAEFVELHLSSMDDEGDWEAPDVSLEYVSDDVSRGRIPTFPHVWDRE